MSKQNKEFININKLDEQLSGEIEFCCDDIKKYVEYFCSKNEPIHISYIAEKKTRLLNHLKNMENIINHMFQEKKD